MLGASYNCETLPIDLITIDNKQACDTVALTHVWHQGALPMTTGTKIQWKI